jgi:surface antigen
VEPRASSVAAVVAAALVLAAGAHAQARLVTAGYPYASSCPQAGDRDDVDRWKMNTCNCTSYAAWALWRNGYRTDWFVAGSMDAWNWPNVARRHGIPSGASARVGAVAVWPAWGKFGHVAVVTAVHGHGTFDVAEYNLPGRRPKFGFDRRTSVSPRGVTFVYVPRRS